MSTNLDDLLKEAPSLSLELAETPTAAPAASETAEAPAAAASAEKQKVEPMQVELTPEEQKMVDEFAKQIDITNAQQVLQYGSASQKKIADFSEVALNSVRTKDLGEVGQMLTDVVAQ